MRKRVVAMALLAFGVASGAAVAVAHRAMSSSRVTLRRLATITPSAGTQSSYWPVAAAGTTMAVGYPAGGVGQGPDAAAVYVFMRSSGGPGGWREVAKLVASDGADGDFFGNDLAVSADTIAVGARSGEGVAGAGSGAVYVFTKPPGGWVGTLHESAKLVASGGAQSAFGSSVTIAGRTILAGAPYADVGANRSEGLVFAFNEPSRGWAGVLHPSARLLASNGVANEDFGQVRALASSGDDVFVGEDGRTPHGGVVYVFHRPHGGWRGTLRTAASLGNAGADDFLSVAGNGPNVVAGSYSLSAGTATVYLFSRAGKAWRTAKHPAAWFSFGIGGNDQGPSVAVWGPNVAAIDDHVSAADHVCPCAGRVFVLREPGSGWSGHVYPGVRPSASVTTGGGANEVTLDAHDLFAAGTGAVDVYNVGQP
jgi:FG-GAP repeat